MRVVQPSLDRVRARVSCAKINNDIRPTDDAVNGSQVILDPLQITTDDQNTSATQENSVDNTDNLVTLPETLTTRYFWRTLFSDINQFCKTCGQCQKVNIKASHRHVPLHEVEPPDSPGERITIDQHAKLKLVLWPSSWPWTC